MKKLSLKDIKSGALMGKPELVTVHIKVNGEEMEYDTHVLPFSYSTAVAQMKAYGENKEALAGVLASVICDEKGKLTFTEDEVRTLFNQALVDAMWSKIVEINVLGKQPSLTKTTKSSSKSASRSVKPTAKSQTSRTEKSKSTPPTSESTEASTSEEDLSKS
ncbi:phage tail assembly chaperone family protein, TAC [Acinetobacter lwoffii]|uniref:phage tail assembly chaperone family protein, TAC n=1 Tax=Acinetobacter lwoffii TaxID=28090 RepID=UPI0030089D56